MTKCLPLVLTLALAILPSAASARFSAIQDSCRSVGNTEITHFSIVNFDSPTPIASMQFIPENPIPGCIIIACSTPAGWACDLDTQTQGVDYAATSPSDRIAAGQIKRGFSYTLDPDFCCYIVRFLGPEGETLLEQEECFNCVHVGVQPETWGHVKNHYR